MYRFEKKKFETLSVRICLESDSGRTCVDCSYVPTDGAICRSAVYYVTINVLFGLFAHVLMMGDGGQLDAEHFNM